MTYSYANREDTTKSVTDGSVKLNSRQWDCGDEGSNWVAPENNEVLVVFFMNLRHKRVPRRQRSWSIFLRKICFSPCTVMTMYRPAVLAFGEAS